MSLDDGPHIGGPADDGSDFSEFGDTPEAPSVPAPRPLPEAPDSGRSPAPGQPPTPPPPDSGRSPAPSQPPPPDPPGEPTAEAPDEQPLALGGECEPGKQLTVLVVDASGIGEADSPPSSRVELELTGNLRARTAARRRRCRPVWREELEVGELVHTESVMVARVVCDISGRRLGVGTVRVSASESEADWAEETVPLRPTGSLRLRFKVEGNAARRKRELSERARVPEPRWVKVGVGSVPADCNLEAHLELASFSGGFQAAGHETLAAGGTCEVVAPLETRRQRARLLLRHADGGPAGCVEFDVRSAADEAATLTLELGPHPRQPQCEDDCERLFTDSKTELGSVTLKVESLKRLDRSPSPRRTPLASAASSPKAPSAREADPLPSRPPLQPPPPQPPTHDCTTQPVSPAPVSAALEHVWLLLRVDSVTVDPVSCVTLHRVDSGEREPVAVGRSEAVSGASWGMKLEAARTELLLRVWGDDGAVAGEHRFTVPIDCGSGVLWHRVDLRTESGTAGQISFSYEVVTGAEDSAGTASIRVSGHDAVSGTYSLVTGLDYVNDETGWGCRWVAVGASGRWAFTNDTDNREVTCGELPERVPPEQVTEWVEGGSPVLLLIERVPGGASNALTVPGPTAPAVVPPPGLARWMRVTVERAEGLTPGDYDGGGITNAYALLRQVPPGSECTGERVVPPKGAGASALDSIDPSAVTLMTGAARGYGSAAWGDAADFEVPQGTGEQEVLTLVVSVLDRCSILGAGYARTDDHFLGWAQITIPLAMTGDREEAWLELRPRPGAAGDGDRARAQWAGHGLGRVLLTWRGCCHPLSRLTVVPLWSFPQPLPAAGFSAKLCLGAAEPPTWLYDPPSAAPLQPNQAVVTNTRRFPVDFTGDCRGQCAVIHASVWDGGHLLSTASVPLSDAPEDYRSVPLIAPPGHAEANELERPASVSLRWRWRTPPPPPPRSVKVVSSQLGAPQHCTGLRELPLTATLPLPAAAIAGRVTCRWKGEGFELQVRVLRVGGDTVAEEILTDLDGGDRSQVWEGRLAESSETLAAARAGDVVQLVCVRRFDVPASATILIEHCAVWIDAELDASSTADAGLRLDVVEARGAAHERMHCVVCCHKKMCNTKVSGGVWKERFMFPAAGATARVVIQVWALLPARSELLGACVLDVGGSYQSSGAGWLPLRPQALVDGGDYSRPTTSDKRLWVRWRWRPAAELTTGAVGRRIVSEAAAKRLDATDVEKRMWAVTGVAQLPEKDDIHKVRGGRALHVTSQRRVLMFGGVNEFGAYEEYVGAYDLGARKWGVAGQMPPSCLRQGHSAVLYEGSKVILFGGFGPGGLDRGLSCVRDVLAITGGSGPVAASTAMSVAAPAPPPAPAHRRAPRPVIGGGAASGYLKSVVEWDTATGACRELETWGSALDHRAGHTAVLFKHKMLVWGGWEVRIMETLRHDRAAPDMETPRASYQVVERRRGDLCSLDLRSLRWKRVRVQGDGPAPRARAGHSAVRLRQSMCVFGGEAERDGGNEPAHLEDPPEVDVQSVSGSSDDDLLDTARSRRGEPAAAKRLKRTVDSGVVFLGDFHTFQLATRSWIPVTARGEAPGPRSNHSASVVSRSGVTSMIVYGGESDSGMLSSCFLFTFDAGAESQDPLSGLWRKVSCRGCARPPPRCTHSAVAVPTHRERKPQRAAAAADASTSVVAVAQPGGQWPAVDDSEKTDAPFLQVYLFGGEGPGLLPGAATDPTLRRTQFSAQPRHLLGATTAVAFGNSDASSVAGASSHCRRLRKHRQDVSRERVEREQRGCPPPSNKSGRLERTEQQMQQIVDRLTRVKPTLNRFQKEDEDILRGVLHAKPRGATRAVTVHGTPGRLSIGQQQSMNERLYYTPARLARHRVALREAQDEQSTNRQVVRKFVSQSRIEHAIDRLHYRAVDRIKARQDGQLTTTDKRRLSLAEEEEMTERLFYRDTEALRDRKRVLETKHLGAPRKHMVRTREEWGQTVARLHAQGKARREVEEVSWGGAEDSSPAVKTRSRGAAA